jgi:hypothetical protein
MREQLIQLIKQAHTDYLLNDDYAVSIYEFIADRLIEAGVILPTVKVGQTVWYIDRYTGNIETDTVKYLTVTKSGIHAQLVYHNQKFWDIYRQGKDVFFTREAVETSLKARNNEKDN